MKIDPVERSRLTEPVLGVPIDVLDWTTTLRRIRQWAVAGESRYVCICNAHSVVTAARDRVFADAVAGADMATPDGAPVAWMLRRLGHGDQRRISGPDLMWRYCAEAATRGEPIYLYGSTPSTLAALDVRLRSAFPGLVIAGLRAPPFRPLTAAEDEADVAHINASGACIVWVSLGCPKQELWMAQHAGRVAAVMVGVGAAFDFHAGIVSRAPVWLQRVGLEWLHRLASEPRRLWRRYLVTNTLFIVYGARQLLRHWLAVDRR